MGLFRRFAVAMEFVAIAVCERETHKAVGLACWRLAHHTEVGDDALAAARRGEALRKRAELFGDTAVCLQRSRWLLRQSRALLDAGALRQEARPRRAVKRRAMAK